MAIENNQKKIIAELSDYAKELKKDLNSKKPAMYAAVVWAYQNQKVLEAISARLIQGQVLISSVQIVADRALRRERVYFSFSPQGRFDVKLSGILVQINDDNSVAEIINPFDPAEDEYLITANSVDTLSLFASKANMTDVVNKENLNATNSLGKSWTRFVSQPELINLARKRFGGFGGFGSFGGLGSLSLDDVDSISGGVPTLSSVISSTGSKEDPDQDTRGGQADDCELAY